MKVTVDDLQATVAMELEGFASGVRDGLAQTIKSVGSKTIRRLRQNSPKQSGKYAKGWTQQVSKDPRKPGTTIYNKAKPQLAHLLENGYQKAAGGRVEGRPHIRPAADEAEENLVTEIRQMIERG